tara:strand:+ start:945 stop:1229 length:285 start_codon:yes stop_codon:yes gene_type:complete
MLITLKDFIIVVILSIIIFILVKGIYRHETLKNKSDEACDCGELKKNIKIKDNSDKISQITKQLTSLESTVGGLEKIRQDFIKESAKKSAKAKN